ncbi:MAG: DUF2007 domain-containing protein [Actinomycetota bacterium]
MTDDLVCVFRGGWGEANAIMGLLVTNGIEATVTSDSGGGAYQAALAFSQGTRVLVRDIDEDEARRVINDAEPIPT